MRTRYNLRPSTMGASGSVLSVCRGRVHSLIDRGAAEAEKLLIDASSFPKEVSTLMHLRLALEMELFDSKVYSDVLKYSKGEDVSEHSIIVEAHSNEELRELLAGQGGDCLKVILTAEASEIDDISSTSVSKNVIGLNLANNILSDESFANSPSLLQVSYLHAGGNSCLGNNFYQLLESTGNLLVLDLSYTENLSLVGPFLAAPQLRRLCLDGCDLKCTVRRNDDGTSISCFWGLVQLNELSLKENLFDSIESLYGLEFFSFGFMQPVLSHLWLNENPFQGVTADRLAVDTYLVKSIPSLVLLSDKMLNTTAIGRSDVSKLLTRNGGGNCSSVGGLQGKGLDNMEKEYLAALKNERDNTVVS